MSVTAPEWLVRHRGTLQAAPDGPSWAVLFGGHPLYLLMPKPAGGTYGCEVMQTNNSKRLGSGATYPTPEDALRGGLDDLRKALGW